MNSLSELCSGLASVTMAMTGGQLHYCVSLLRNLASNVPRLLDSSVLSTCRQLGLVKQKTARGVRGGRKVKAVQLLSSQLSRTTSLTATVLPTRDHDDEPLLPVETSGTVASDAPVVSSPDSPLTPASPPLLPFQFAALSPGERDSQHKGSSVDPPSVGDQTINSSMASVNRKPMKNLLIGVWNAQSTIQKAAEIHDMIVDESLDLLLITETWLKEAGDEPVIAQMKPTGYCFRQRPRQSDRDGGGIAIIYKKSLTVKVLAKEKFNTFETLNFTLTRGKVTVYVMGVYHPPYSETNRITNSMFRTEFCPVVSSLAASHKYLMIIGDINIHFDEPSDSDTKQMCKLLDSIEFTQHVTGPTQMMGHTLDWVISRTGLDLVKSVSLVNNMISDHSLVLVTTCMSRPCNPTKVVCTRNIKGMDKDAFRSDLLSSTLVIAPPEDVDQLVHLYSSTLSSLLDKYAPEVQKCIVERPDTAWMTPAVLSMKKTRRRAEKKWRKSRLEVHRQIYRQTRNRCKMEAKKARAEHIKEVLDGASNDPRKMYCIVNKLLGKDSVSPVLPEMEDQAAADALSAFFADKIKTIRESFTDDVQPSIEDDFVGTPLTHFEPVTDDQLRKIIRRCNATSSSVDPVPTKIVIEHLDILLPVLVNIINASLASAVVPSLFKIAVIKPLLKKPSLDPNVCKNFRPVSNLPYISKLAERVVADQLTSHLEHHNLLDKFQSAYRPRHSCETALLRLLNDLLCTADAGNLTLLVLLDLSAAFDVIDHSTLLTRLQKEAGIVDSALEWFRSYLDERKQHVSVDQASSVDTPMVCGVPQGSVLGPMLFSLYTSQLGPIIEKHGLSRKMFADDTEIYRSFEPEEESAREAVRSVEDCCTEVKTWMQANRLKLNDDKTEALVCGLKSSLEKVTISRVQVGQASIPLSDSVRNLGLHVDKQLTMVSHINSVVRACHFHIRTLGRLRPVLNKQTANAVAVSLVLSRLDYCNSCLWGISKSEIERLQHIQNTAARIVMRKKRTEHITPVLRELHWLPVQKRIEHKVMTQAYNCFYNSAPEYLRELVPRYQPQRCLRSADQCRLELPSVSTGNTNKKTMGVRSFTNSAPSLWNALPLVLKKSESSETFRKALKTHLFLQTE